MYKKQEVVSDQFIYVEFPFGTLDYDGLQENREYHKQKLKRKVEGEEKVA